jgi:uncharacterized protein (TIGR02118 family)
MIKSVSLLFRNPALSPEEFRAYWEDVHAPLVKRLLPGLVHYCGNFPVPGVGESPHGGAIECDGIVELGWPDLQTMNRDMTSPEFNTPEREASSARLMDLTRTRVRVVEVVDGLTL